MNEEIEHKTYVTESKFNLNKYWTIDEDTYLYYNDDFESYHEVLVLVNCAWPSDTTDKRCGDGVDCYPILKASVAWDGIRHIHFYPFSKGYENYFSPNDMIIALSNLDKYAKRVVQKDQW